MILSISRKIIVLILLLFVFHSCITKSKNWLEENYVKEQFRIEMRDGIKLHTSVYSPIDKSEKYPILIWRTPYSTAPYDEGFYTRMQEYIAKEGYILVYQDVRGRFMSEGKYDNMRPYLSNKTEDQTDETTDTYDTIEWLINNVPNNNGNVGIWGISYPGFYAALSTMESHPALKAVSPQAPIANWFIGDDMHHHGAFTLLLNFNFFKVFGIEPDTLYKTWPKDPDYVSPDAYTFFKELGPIKNVNEKYFNFERPFWNEIVKHGSYDEFWQSRNTLQHFDDVQPAVLNVGGWFDGENCFGALQTYQSIEKKNPTANNKLVMGPWSHGGWVRTNGDSLGNVDFGSMTGKYYIKNIEIPFFDYHLKNKGEPNLPEATIFNTGINEWRQFDEWPPSEISKTKIYFQDKNGLSFLEPTKNSSSYDEYVSDPNKPIPYTSLIVDSKNFYPKPYMVEDQRFASTRPDVIVYQTESLENDVTIAGAINVNLFVSTTGTDADFVVKLIDVYPYDKADSKPNPNNIKQGAFQQLLRGDIFRGKFRNSYEKPEPFTPNKITNVKFGMNDLMHTFKKGHRIMVQVQSSWFPLFDMNPQKFCDIYSADEEDFQKATHKIYHSKNHPSSISVGVLK